MDRNVGSHNIIHRKWTRVAPNRRDGRLNNTYHSTNFELGSRAQSAGHLAGATSALPREKILSGSQSYVSIYVVAPRGALVCSPLSSP